MSRTIKLYTLKILFAFFFVVLTVAATAQQPFIKLVEPSKTSNTVSASRQFIIGSTCKACTVDVNGKAATVIGTTGAFAAEVNLTEGDASYEIVASSGTASAKKTINFIYKPISRPVAVADFSIEKVTVLPAGDLVLMAGDKLQFIVKAQPGNSLTTIDNTALYELPAAQANGLKGIYQGEYIVKATDQFTAQKLIFTLINKAGQKTFAGSKDEYAILSPLSSDVAETKGRLAFLEYGLGADRLGGAKIGYLDEGIPLKIIGKVGDDFKINLAPDQIAYINESNVTLMPKGSLVRSSLTGQGRVWGDETFDYVTLALDGKLPYQSIQLVNPAKIVVDIFGATINTNWLTQLLSAKEVTNVSLEQKQEDVVRLTIDLKHQQHWGYGMSYDGNNLKIKIKQQPKNLTLNKLTIAIDAGHGGSNTGAGGPTGSSEKMLTLSISKKLQKVLTDAGAKVLMTRTTDASVNNNGRILTYRDAMPDLLVSIHLNSAGDPFRAGGTSSLYKYVGFRPLSLAIHKRMLELGLKEYGNIGNFNFMLNSPTEYPNALVETLFLSNLEEEALVLDEQFQQKMAEKIKLGIEDFLKNADALNP